MGLFSILIPTRNRPSQLREALRSVLSQTCGDIEIVVVDDGSDEEHVEEYGEIIQAANRPAQFHSLQRRLNGHGPGYARNFAASLTSGRYVCFLDDDDVWTDDDYLSRIQSAIGQRADAPDLIFSNQTAFFGNRRNEGPLWLEGLAARLERSTRRPGEGGLYRVTVEDLLNADGFCHLNTMIVRRGLFDAVGGMDETIRWEQDHDLYLRLIDRAETMLLSPAFVARHNIPDPAKAASSTTSLNEIQRRLYQLRVFDKAALFAAHPAIQAHGRLYKGYTLKRITQALAARKDYRSASFYAREALGAAPTLKWATYCIYLATARLHSLLK